MLKLGRGADVEAGAGCGQMLKPGQGGSLGTGVLLEGSGRGAHGAVG